MYGGRAPKGEICTKVCMYVCMYDCCCGAGVAKTSFCGLLRCFLSPLVVILGPGFLVVLGTVGTPVGVPYRRGFVVVSAV